MTFSTKSGKDIDKFEEFPEAERGSNGILYLSKYVTPDCQEGH